MSPRCCPRDTHRVGGRNNRGVGWTAHQARTRSLGDTNMKTTGAKHCRQTGLRRGTRMPILMPWNASKRLQMQPMPTFHDILQHRCGYDRRGAHRIHPKKTNTRY